MKAGRIHLAWALIAAFGLAAVRAGAADSSSEAGDTAGALFIAKPAAPTPQPAPNPASSRVVSPTIAAEIDSGMPGYGPAGAGSPSQGAAAGADEAEKAKNQMPRLPVETLRKYEVRESRIPVFRTRDLYTDEGLTALAFKEHPGYRIGNLFNLNAYAAHERIIAEQLFAARLDLVDTAFAMASGGDGHEIEAMRQDIIEDGFNKDSPVGK